MRSRIKEAMIKNLSDDERAVIIYHYHEDLDFDSIAQRLGKAVNSIRVMHYRALSKVREAIEPRDRT